MTANTATTTPLLTNTDKKLLELLIKGASGRVIAERLGYKEGTTRVYLHSLYKRIGVNNKTSAATWYLDMMAANDPDAVREAAEHSYRVHSFGEMALKQGLLESLGIMGVFLGPYGRMWEVGHTLKGDKPSIGKVADEQLRGVARELWQSLLIGNFVAAKRQFDAGILPKLFVASPSDAVVLTAALILGGFSTSAKRALGGLPARRAGSLGVTVDELRALNAASDAVEKSSDSAVNALHGLAESSRSKPVLRHVLLVTLFHLYRQRGDVDRSAATANALWVEAESVRQQLEASGDRTLPAKASLPEPPAVATAKLSAYLEKLTA